MIKSSVGNYNTDNLVKPWGVTPLVKSWVSGQDTPDRRKNSKGLTLSCLISSVPNIT